jgi:biopolymer transport protein ExbD
MKSKMELSTKTDVVPVINVSLVVVLTLMIISPSINQADTDINLPEARATQSEEENKVEITCALNGQIFVADLLVIPEEIAPMLTEILRDNPEAITVVRADRDLPYGEVEKVLAEVQKAKPSEISLATSPEGSGRSPDERKVAR